MAVLCGLLFKTASIPSMAAAPQIALPVLANKAVSLSIFIILPATAPMAVFRYDDDINKNGGKSHGYDIL
jgi:hypothetical protein